jgi:hypothetical protein
LHGRVSIVLPQRNQAFATLRTKLRIAKIGGDSAHRRTNSQTFHIVISNGPG